MKAKFLAGRVKRGFLKIEDVPENLIEAVKNEINS